MSYSITAIYENGVLRPLVPLTLPEHTQVQLHIQPMLTSTLDVAEHRRRVQEVLVATGLSLPAPDTSPVFKPLSAERRKELAQLFGRTGRPLSELIIEERKGR